MKTKLKKFGAWLMAAALAFAGAGAYADAGAPAGSTKVAEGFYQSAATYENSTDFYITSVDGLRYFRDFVNGVNDYYLGAGGKSKVDYTSVYVFSGKTVNLCTDIDLGSENFTAIGYDTKGGRHYFYGSFNGHGHKIANFSYVWDGVHPAASGSNAFAGFFAYVNANAPMTVSNLTFENPTVGGYGRVGTLIGSMSAQTGQSVIISNCHVVGTINLYNGIDDAEYTKNKGRFIGGLVGHVGDGSAVRIVDCSVEGSGSSVIRASANTVGGITGYTGASGVAIENCLVSGVSLVAESGSGIGGISSSLAGPSQNVIRNCTVSNVVGTAATATASYGIIAGMIETEGATIEDCKSFDVTFTQCENPIVAQCAHAKAIVGSGIVRDSDGKLSAGVYEHIPGIPGDDRWIAEGYEAVQGAVAETWEIRPLPPVAQIGEKTYTTLEAAFAAVKPSETVELLCDVDLGGEAWAPVQLNGNFDGKGFTVSNLVVSAPDQNGVGFFSEMKQEYAFTVKNVDFVNVDVKGKSNVGALFGWHCYGLVSNVTVSGTIKVEATGGDGAGYPRTGVICGGWSYGTYVDVTVDGGDKTVSYVKGPKSVVDGRYVAGFVGHSDEGDSYRNCTVKNLTVSGKWLSGGLCGDGPGHGPCVNCTVEDVALTGYYSGALFGWFWDFGSQPPVVENATIRNVTFGNNLGCGTIGGYGPDLAVIVKNATIEGVEPLKYNYQVYVTEDGDNYHYADVETAIAEAEKLEDITVTSDKIEIPDGYVRYVKGDLWGVREADPVVRVGETGYPSIAAALAASSGEVEITLIANAKSSRIELSNSKNSQVDSLTIDLNGFTLTNDGGDAFMTENRRITVKDSVGTGVFNHIGTDDCVWAKGSTGGVVLESGTYHLVDAYGLAYGVPSLLVIKGGTYNINPGSDKYGRSYVPAGYEFTDNGDGTWTVKQVMVAQIGETKFASIAEALAAVGDGQTVKVLKSGNVVTEYAKRIDEEGYGEGVGANRLIFGTDAKFVLDLNGQTLTGRINFTKGDMTVSNGTLRATSQVLNVFGRKTASSAEEAAESHTTLTIAADCSVEGGNFGVAVFGGDQGNIYWPLGFGETVNIYGKIKALYGAIQNSGNVGMDTYEDNIGQSDDVEAVTNALKMGVSAMMAKYGPVVNVYDGAVLATVPGETEDSSQGISSQGMATYNVYGGKISGAEAIGVKGGIVNVMGGEMTAFGVKANPIEAVNSGTEVSGGGIAISTSYNGNYPIVVNVTGGTVKSANNAALLFEHSWTFDKQKQPVAPCPVVQGVTFAVSGGTFIGAKGELAIKVEDAIEGDAATYPANFIWPELDEDGKETGYPLCSSRIPADSVAEGYVAKDNKNGTWTVTAGSPEIKTDTKDVVVTPTQKGEVEVPDEEAQQAAEAVKDDIVKAMKDPEVSDLVGTGLKENVFTQDGQGNTILKDDVVDQLKAQAIADAKAKIVKEQMDADKSEEEARSFAEGKTEEITTKVNTAITKNSSSNTESHVEVKLTAVEVAVSKESTEATVVESTLTKATFDIKPIVTLVTKIDDVVTKTTIELKDGEELANPVLVRLWLNADFIGTVAKVTHKHRNAPDEVASARVQTGVNEKGETRKYVEVSWKRFSEAIVEAEDTTGKACLANGKMFEKVADALSQTNDLPADATIELLADCAETTLALGVNRTLVLSGHAFTGSLAAVDGKEMVKTKAGEIFYAQPKIDVPVGTQGNGVPIRGFNFTGIELPAGETEKEQKATYLAQTSGNGNFRWQNYVLFGSDVAAPKLIPQIVKAATGFSTVTIKAQDGYTVSTPEKCGVGVKFQLMRCDTSATGTYVLVGEPQDEPVFQVDVKKIGAKTYWKIQTIFETTEDLPTQAPTTAN